MSGKLYLIPSTLGDTAPIATLPAQSLERLRQLDILIVESPKPARRFLQRCGIRLGARHIEFLVLDEHTADDELPRLLAPAVHGSEIGLLSDAGCPAVADPGARLVRLAHAHGVEVVPLVGPSSIMLALMGSGLDGQHFAFHGYLPVPSAPRTQAIQRLEKAARTARASQIFIETPYRNNQMLTAILQTCAPDTLLCVAADLTLATQFIRTQSIGEWRASLPDLNRRPAVFLLGHADA